MPDDAQNITPAENDKWSQKLQFALYASMIVRAGKDPEFKARCTESPTTAKDAAWEEAKRIGLDVDIPDKDVIFFIPERDADYCHIFSLTPRPGSMPASVDINSFLKCCYPQYVGSDLQSFTVM